MHIRSQIRIHPLLPYTIVAVLCVLTGIVCFTCLPETVNSPTPETMASFVTKPQNQNNEIKDLLPEGKEETMKEDVNLNKQGNAKEELMPLA